MASLAVIPGQSEPIANLESEAGLIGAMLIENKIIDKVADIVSPEDFSDPFFARTYAAILAEHNLGNVANVISLRRTVGEEGFRSLIGLTSGSGAHVIGAGDFAREVHELGCKRRMVEGLESLVAEAKQIGTGKAELSAADLAASVESIIAYSSPDDEAKQIEADAALSSIVDGLADDVAGVKSGILAFDQVVGDIRPSDMVIVGARPGMGKTATAVSYALGAARKGHGVLFVSLEMSVDALAERMAADLCFDSSVQVPYSSITRKTVTSEQGREMARAVERIGGMPLLIVHRGGMRIGAINTAVRRAKRRFAAKGKSLDLVIVDYLQIANPDERETSQYSRVSEVSKGLKALAINQSVGVMALAQLSRDVEKRGGSNRPTLADLRDSGQIEQDADAVCFLYAPEYYLKLEEPSQTDPNREKWEAAMHEAASKLEFIAAKVRRGPGGTGHGQFYRHFQAVRG